MKNIYWSYWMAASGFDPYSGFLRYVEGYDAGENDPLMDDIAFDFEMDDLSGEYEIDWDGEFKRDEIDSEGVYLDIPLKKKGA